MPCGPSDLFRVLSVETRLGILDLLARRGPLCTSAIAKKLGITPAAVSQHLALLRGAGLVTRERHGYRVPYSVNQRGLDDCCGRLVTLCSCGCGCHQGSARPREPRSTLGALRRRERALRRELDVVEERIRMLSPGAGTRGEAPRIAQGAAGRPRRKES